LCNTSDISKIFISIFRPNGIRFSAAPGTTEFAKRWNPQPGDIVSFKHHGYLLASKKPKFPTIYRLRTDIVWDDVVQNWKEQKISSRGTLYLHLFLSCTLNLLSILGKALALKRNPTKNKPRGYWNAPDNRRRYFCEYAKAAGFDALQPNNWANLTPNHIISKMVSL